MNMNRHILRKFSSVAAVVLLVAGQGMAQQQLPEGVIRTANQIRKAILMLPNYGPFDYLTFSIGQGEDGYRVVLKGYASRPTLKTSAERVVKNIENVESVQNEIEVLPASGHDEDIRLAAYLKIYQHSTLSRYNPNRGIPMFANDLARASIFGISQTPPTGYHPMSIIVKRGNIILEGVVDTDFDKIFAGMQANSVAGAFSVTNNLVVLNPKKKKA